MNTVLFDLDGTLLPLDQDKFIKSYFSLIAQKFSRPPYNYNPEQLVNGVIGGTKAMVKNNGEVLNYERFWTVFAQMMGDEIKEYKSDFDDFYANEFLQLEKLTNKNQFAFKCIKTLKNKGYNVVAATNPMFPAVATKARLSWAGVSYDQFDLVTTYENCSYCKPNLDYYNQVLEKINKRPQECLMVGNDVLEDMCTSELGIQTFLVTDCLVNRTGQDISCFKHGTFEEFSNMVENLPSV